VFFCQPLGQLAATIVALIAVARQRDGIAGYAVANCSDPIGGAACAGTLDSIWRWVIGVGVIPAFIALWFRLTIIESPRYTADVGKDSLKAASEVSRYLPRDSKSVAQSSESANGNGQPSTAAELGETSALSRHESTTEMVEANGAGHSSSPGGIFSNSPALEEGARDFSDYKAPPEPSWEDFKIYFWHKGNLRTLMATSLCWFCVDLPFSGSE
jgi:PHS family inorganic phosphate transporter-like MFS transporter